MPYTFHTRLEPRTRSDDLAHGLAARVYDPAWLLARQWQLGELLGDDGGSPIRVHHTGAIDWISGYSDAGGSRPVAPGDGPVEAWAEAAPVTWTLRLRVDVGRALARAARAAGEGARVADLEEQYPIDPAAWAGDPSAVALLALAAGQIPDGRTAYAAMAPGLRAEPPTLPSGVDAALLDAARAWLAFCDEVLGVPPGGGWDGGRMEHAFTVEAEAPDRTLELRAEGHGGGEVGWWSFDATVSAGRQPATTGASHDAELVPTRAGFRGMPNPRWWEVEDGSIDLGGVEAHPADLARMAVLNFALVYGNDHVVVPVQVPLGAVFRTNHVLVTDTFGVTILVGPAHAATTAGAEHWTMFTSTRLDRAGGDEAFVLPATAVDVVTSAPVEDVRLLRDEMANLAWVVEHAVEGADGGPQLRSERNVPAPVAGPPPSGPLAYRLGTTVPPHWFPLVPQRAASGDAPVLRMQAMAYTPHPDAEPWGTFVTLGTQVADDRVPREGRRLLRDRVLTRWTDGSARTWSRRRSVIGRGEGSSGLRFDVAEPFP